MEEIKTTYQSFAEIARIIREGKLGQLHIGDTISTRHTLRDRLLWRIIGINADAALDGTPETVTVMLCNPPIWCSFDGGRKGFPYGCNEWEPSDVRARLQGDVLDDFDAEDRAVIVPVRKATYSPQNERIRHTSDKLFLLSASEIGIAVDDDAIHDEGKPYAYFEDGDDEKRRLTDADGDSCYWWLRSPYPSNAYSVRIVDPSGALHNIIATDGGGLAAACVIGDRPISADRRTDDEGAEDIQHLQDEMAQAIADAVQDVLPALRRAVNIAARIVQQIGGEAEGQSHE